MTTIRALGSLLTASAETRTLTYKLLPYGVEGRTNVGKVIASKGSVTYPEDTSTLVANLEHDGTKPVAKFTSVREEDDGLVASVRVLDTQAGNDLLTEAAEGVRTGISVEIDNPVIRAGRLIAGLLTGAGFVAKPAFPTATLLAADAGEVPDDIEINGVLYRRVDETETEEPTPGSDDAEQSAGSENPVTTNITAAAATAPAGLHAASTATKEKTANEVFQMLASEHTAGGDRRMLAALADIVPGNVLGLEQPQFVGELWSGKAYQRKIVPLFNHANLTSFEVKGWHWVNKPVVAPYSGNKTAVPSNTVSTAPDNLTAERIAGAHDIDRKFKDFGDAGFFEAYYKAMTESYAKVSDAQVLADVLTAAGAPITVGTVPTGVSRTMAMIVDGALDVLNGTDSLPSFAIVATGLYRDLLLIRNEDTLAYLNAALGLEDGTVGSFRVVPSSALATGRVLVGTREAVTVHELGETPIRVEAENIAQGGVDAGVFGYYAVNVHDADGLSLVDDGVA